MSCVKVATMALNTTHSQMSYMPHSHWQQPSSRPSISLVSPTHYQPSNHTQPRPSSRGGPSEIIPRLYISDLSFVENQSALSSYGITHVLSSISGKVLIPPSSGHFASPQHLYVRVEDLPFAELAAHLPQTTAWISAALRSNPNARVVVHCAEGISRSVSVVAGFLMAQYGWTPSEAIQYIKSKRRGADPNMGFIQQLGEYGRTLSRS